MSARKRLAAAVLLAWCAPAAAAAAAPTAERPLIDAVRDRRHETVRALLALRVDVNMTEPDGATALHWAAYLDDVDVVEWLIAAGARVDAANDYAVTPMHIACVNANAAVASALLAAGSNPNRALPSGESPLMTATRAGAGRVVDLLLSAGAAIDAQEATHGQTALMWALAEGHIDVTRTLLMRGADVRLRSTSGFTALMFAVRDGYLDAVKLLVAAGADVNEEGRDGTSVLVVATVRSHLDVARYLLDRGADPNADHAGYTALHWAAGTWESTLYHDYDVPTGEWSTFGGLRAGKLEYIAMLLAYGANPNVRIRKPPLRLGFNMFNETFVLGATPFLLASMVGDLPTMRLLLANGADPSVADDNGTSPLMVAAGMAYVPVESRVNDDRARQAVQLLLNLGADLSVANALGETALHAAAYAGFDSVAQLLIDRGAPLNAANKHGQTALKIAEGFINNAMLFVHPSTAAILRKAGGVEP